MVNANAIRPTNPVENVPVKPQKIQATKMEEKQASRCPNIDRCFFCLVKEVVKHIETMHSPARHEIVSINRNDEKFTAIVDGPLDSFRGTLEPKITATIAPRINVEQTKISIIRTCSFKITALSNNDQIIVKVAKEEATA